MHLLSVKTRICIFSGVKKKQIQMIPAVVVAVGSSRSG